MLCYVMLYAIYLYIYIYTYTYMYIYIYIYLATISSPRIRSAPASRPHDIT